MVTDRNFTSLVSTIVLQIVVWSAVFALTCLPHTAVLGEYVGTPGEKKNLLFIMSDDLRPELSVYGRKHVHSPNFDRLAKRGVTFDRVYNQVPVCFPSRHSLLTGLRPDTTGILTWTDAQMPFLDTLMSILVRNQYYSAGFGKLFHHPHNKSAEYVIRHTSYIIRHTSYAIHHTSYIIRHTSYVVRRMSCRASCPTYSNGPSSASTTPYARMHVHTPSPSPSPSHPSFASRCPVQISRWEVGWQVVRVPEHGGHVPQRQHHARCHAAGGGFPGPRDSHVRRGQDEDAERGT